MVIISSAYLLYIIYFKDCLLCPLRGLAGTGTTETPRLAFLGLTTQLKCLLIKLKMYFSVYFLLKCALNEIQRM